MDLNTSVSQVSTWLDSLPFDQQAPSSPPSPSATCRALKRKRSLHLNESRERRYPASPPGSNTHSQTLRKARIKSMPATPAKRTRPDLDNDQTPRAQVSVANPLTNPPSLSSRSESSLASQSDASMSRGSKRSKRSQSPTKLFPMYGSEGHRLVRDSISTTAPRGKLPSALSELYRDLFDVAGRYGIIPRSMKGALDQHLQATMSLDRVHDHMFFDDTPSQSLVDSESPTMASKIEIIRRASRIADRSDQCSQMLSDEAAWNCLVHCPLLDLFTFDICEANDDLLTFMPCTTTNIDSTYHRFPDPASRVDFVFYFVPDNDPTLSQPPAGIPCFNWTSDRMLQQYPLAFSIETKRYGGNAAKGEQQMGIWHAAQWDFLITRAGADAVAKLEFLPGIVVQGHTWSLVITTRNEGTTTVLCGLEFGNTGSVVGVFQVMAGLRVLRKWSLEVLWPWYKMYLPGLCADAIAGVGA
ncbi:hypothetical protein FPOAC2_00027 [Fusarium poae]|uniref:PD-(D/E)XK nuclease-like domain-containing protein n=1 Tax=Fusarium poae TaxID=36050 RepID=A0A1B8B004_FUSPO|nr:hypothetical protein FPOAC1_000016 [Fusarium poae]KAG8674053.1 hypothetical protein FPOAC1_000016 [Fusarium poae]OBS26074.1 hypothetical protein FPOA_00018 [Fusarium poae]